MNAEMSRLAGGRLRARAYAALIGVIGCGLLLAGSAVANANRETRAAAKPTKAHISVAAPCASQGSCKYCGSGGIWTGGCTRAKLEFNVRWCGRQKHLRGANRTKCKAEARYLSSGPPYALQPYIQAICAPSAARTIYAYLAGVATRTAGFSAVCAGIGVWAGLHALVFSIL